MATQILMFLFDIEYKVLIAETCMFKTVRFVRDPYVSCAILQEKTLRHCVGLICLQGADIVIALTHMRWPNDVRLAECAPEIDLILGGHDHDYLVKQVG